MLLSRLDAKGVRLHLRGEQIKWSTNGVDGVSVAEMRDIKRLTPQLRGLLGEIERIVAPAETAPGADAS
jgi:hypothetical protein